VAWDSSRRVPWQRLVRDWLIYVGLMSIVLIIVSRDRLGIGLFAGLFISGPLFVGIGAVLAKFGYQRKSLRELREAAARERAAAAPAATPTARQRPAPTRRTSTGPPRRPGTKRRR
jgi:hypothetical protein